MNVIIGDGTVGKALGMNMGVTPLGPSDEKVEADVVIICVPTLTIDDKQDLSAVIQAIGRISATNLVIIRSTILPGTTEKLQKYCKFPLMFVPEWGFEATMVEDLAHPSFYVLGYTQESERFKEKAIEILPKGDHYEWIPATAAEFSKYFANIWGSSQVVLANSYYDWVMEITNDPQIYELGIKAALHHPNMPKWGWRIHDQGFRGYGGKCLPKDTQAAISQYPHRLWRVYEEYNHNLRNQTGRD